MTSFRLAEPRLPSAPARYTERDEASFRGGLLRYLRDIRDQIDILNASDTDENTSHIHDTRYYTETEIDLLLGALEDEIDGKSALGHTHVEADITDLQAYLLADVDEVITGEWEFLGDIVIGGYLTSGPGTLKGFAPSFFQHDFLSLADSDPPQYIGGLLSYIEATVASTGGPQALEAYTYASHSSGTIALALGTASNIELNAAGAITNAQAYRGAVGTGNSATGSITTGAVFYAADGFNTGSGSIGTLHGLYVASLTAGTNNYAIYTNEGDVFFGDYTEIKHTISTTSGYSYGGKVDITQDAATTEGPIGFGVNLGLNASTGTIAEAYGADIGLNVFDGDLTYGTALNVYVGLESGYADTVTEAAGLTVSAYKVAGTITTAVGIEVGDITIGGTNNYAIRTGSGLLDFGDNIIFRGTLAPPSPQTYTPTNVTTDRSYDANSTTLAEIADVLGTLIADLQTIGLIN